MPVQNVPGCKELQEDRRHDRVRTIDQLSTSTGKLERSMPLESLGESWEALQSGSASFCGYLWLIDNVEGFRGTVTTNFSTQYFVRPGFTPFTGNDQEKILWKSWDCPG